MRLDYYHIDSFTDGQFAGNPAGVCLLQFDLPADLMLSVARENGLAETAFIKKTEKGYHIRWFTPELEIDLCGHATLASAYVIKTFVEPEIENICFESVSGPLTVTFDGSMISMDFPSRMPVPAELPEMIAESLNIRPVEVYKSRDYILLYKSEDDIRKLTVNKTLLDRISLGMGGVCVTAAGRQFDFVSRFFTPQASILEDPVTGSAHASLIPFWAARLEKQVLTAKQLSERSGILYCKNKSADRVIVAGHACLFSRGVIEVPD